MTNKVFLVKFEFFSGFFEDIFYQQIYVPTEKDAILYIVSYFINTDDAGALKNIEESLGKRWSVKKFWEQMDMNFFNGTEGFRLLYIKKIDCDLDEL